MANPLEAAAESAFGTGVRASSGAHLGAVHNRLTSDWILASIRSADQEIRGDLITLRARSRELVRNNDTASRYKGLVEENVVGDEGIRLQSQVKDQQGKLALELNQRIENAWNGWAEAPDVTGQLHWTELQSLVVGSVAQDGEGLVRMIGGYSGNRFRFALHLMDPDQLDQDFHRDPGTAPDGSVRNEVRMGVERDEWGRPVAYHCWDHHPTEYSGRGRERIRIPADEIIHLFRPGRVNQTRGIPWYTPALYKLHMVGKYEEAEIVASRMAAAKGGFFEKTADAAVPDPNTKGSEKPIRFEIEPGKMDALPVGWTFSQWDPQHPTTAFKDFHKAMVRGIASGLGVSYTSLSNNLEDINYSSIRAGLLNERDAWRKVQKWLIHRYQHRVFREWMKWAVTSGALQLPTMQVDRWARARWQPRGWPWVDPLKDIQAAAMERRMGLNSLTRIAAERGRDIEEVFREIRQEEELADELGIELTTDFSSSGPKDSGDAAAFGPALRRMALTSGKGRDNGNER